MATCSVQTISNENKCLFSLTSFQLDLVQAQILCNLKAHIQLGTDVTCDIQTLLSDAKCFASLTSFQLQVVQTQLLCDISALIAAGGNPNVIDGALVLHNLTDGNWYSSSLVMVGTDALFTPPVITAVPPVGTPDTVVVADPDDLTTHVVGVDTDGGGNVSLVVAQADAGTPGQTLILTADDLSTHTLRTIADSGGVYQLIAV